MLDLAQHTRCDCGLFQSCVCCGLLLFATPQTLTSQLAVAEKKVTAKWAESLTLSASTSSRCCALLLTSVSPACL
jgi:hypothetical protein